tara:strand:- start:921 stop:1193 length:273 start_codon:yes stop_codon:yes gene_type:complete
MHNSKNIIEFPNLINQKKEKMAAIRDEIEKILTNYAINERDLWAVSLAAGRFASINLEKLDGEKQTINFFKNCIETQRKYELTRNSSNVT